LKVEDFLNRLYEAKVIERELYDKISPVQVAVRRMSQPITVSHAANPSIYHTEGLICPTC